MYKVVLCYDTPMSTEDNELMSKIVSLAKRRGFIFPGSEIYGGLAGTYDYGHLGELLRLAVLDSWRKKFVSSRSDMYFTNADILMNGKVWQATGHVDSFTDPLDDGDFNTMFSTTVGARKDEQSTSYLRPETAQGMFVNFKNIVDTFSPKLPFGMAQIGKAFRNEIAPRDFIFRKREFEQMEIEYFVEPNEWEKYFEYWKDEMLEWMEEIGLDMNKVHEVEVSDKERAHYSKRTIDFEFEYPFGQKELYGLVYRTDYDLKKHAESSGAKLAIDGMTPHVIEPSMGAERTILAILVSAYKEDNVGDDTRVYLDLKPDIAPYKVAVSPLLRNKPELAEKAREVFGALKFEFGNVVYDDNGNIGKRYRRQDEIGTPFCVVIDFETLEGDTTDTVTVRDRNTTDQERVAISELQNYFQEKLS